jgi:drug/metabolite transporter (DMT)-like permease
MQKQSDLGGVAAMLATTAFFVTGDSFMKVVTEDLPPFEIMFIRAIAGSIVCTALIVARGEWGSISTLLHPRTLLRAVGDTASALFYVAALARLPISDVTAILQLTPVIVIVGGALLLREKIGAVPIVLALIGFAGALMVAQPSADGIPPAALIALGSALLGVVRDLGGRVVPKHVPVMVIVLASMLVMIVTAGTLTLGFQNWVAPTGRHLGFLSIAAALVVCGNFALLLAYRIGRTEVVAPFYYSFALWGIVSGLIVWGALPNALALVGTVLIAGSGIAIVVLDQRRGKRSALADAA